MRQASSAWTTASPHAFAGNLDEAPASGKHSCNPTSVSGPAPHTKPGAHGATPTASSGVQRPCRRENVSCCNNCSGPSSRDRPHRPGTPRHRTLPPAPPHERSPQPMEQEKTLKQAPKSCFLFLRRRRLLAVDVSTDDGDGNDSVDSADKAPGSVVIDDITGHW